MSYLKISLVVSDVDGTLITPQKEITPAAKEAVTRLREAGLKFAIASSRPARGLRMIAQTLELDTPMSGFNGGRILAPDLSALRTLPIDAAIVEQIVPLLQKQGLSVWLFVDNDWYITDRAGPRVDNEIHAVQFDPIVVSHFDPLLYDRVIKIVGVSLDHDLVKLAETEIQFLFEDMVSATRSQPIYLDITNNGATKGEVVKFLSRQFDIPVTEIATIGDMMNDVLMFRESGYSIAMGNAAEAVKSEANFVTETNVNEGFARAMNHLLSLL